MFRSDQTDNLNGCRWGNTLGWQLAGTTLPSQTRSLQLSGSGPGPWRPCIPCKVRHGVGRSFHPFWANAHEQAIALQRLESGNSSQRALTVSWSATSSTQFVSDSRVNDWRWTTHQMLHCISFEPVGDLAPQLLILFEHPDRHSCGRWSGRIGLHCRVVGRQRLQAPHGVDAAVGLCPGARPGPGHVGGKTGRAHHMAPVRRHGVGACFTALQQECCISVGWGAAALHYDCKSALLGVHQNRTYLHAVYAIIICVARCSSWHCACKVRGFHSRWLHTLQATAGSQDSHNRSLSTASRCSPLPVGHRRRALCPGAAPAGPRPVDPHLQPGHH